MTLILANAAHHAAARAECDADPDSQDYERTLLLELAIELQRWPAQNQVFQRALDHAARELAHLASEARSG